MGARGARLAAEFEQVVQELTGFLEQCPDDRWKAVCGPERWTVAQTAQHVSGQFPLEMEYITAAADGKALPGYSWDDINTKNDHRAAKNAAVSKASVIDELQRGAS